MAIQTITPYSTPSDLLPLREIYDLLKETGHPVSNRDLKAWIRKDGLDVVRYRGVPHVSYSDILLAHRDAVLAGRI
ncbi:hypothetical protein E6R18_32820 [Streptomyces sp. A1277]|uniref:hypothetical protein n=1 Tax=Streptomyces sp. A1277 TaxID=2563103 RepID=UPI0010A24227|nr:hypothetical protein [Streptomyces sp. A1277]THA22731.1 hypothetical protein E6R18_32820 [Streptomyces sp. A1277]